MSGDSNANLSPLVPRPAKVVDEDTFTAHIEKIIQRDFFPDLPKINDHLEWLEAKRRNDFTKMNEIQMRYTKKRTASEIRETPNPYSTPDFARTPQLDSNKRRRLEDSEDVSSGQSDNNTDNELPPNVSLDKYLNNYKSEDDDSFDKVLEKNNKEHRQKYHWLFEKKDLPKLAFDGPNDKKGFLTWNWTPKNSLMYSPEGGKLIRCLNYMTKSSNSVPAPIVQTGQKQDISHTNTRIRVDENERRRLKEKQAQQAAQQAEMYSVIKDPQQIFEERRRMKNAKVDLDQLYSNSSTQTSAVAASPRVNGYGFVSTPQIAPDQSPFITWGEIESTPLRLDDLETPITPSSAPQFKIPDMPSRDKITLELANKAEARMRAKQPQARRKSTPGVAGNKTPLSPAGQQLVEKMARRKTGSGLDADDQLRASYNTPGRVQSPRTPSVLNAGTPSRSPAATPTFATPKAVTPSRSKLGTPKVTVREKQPSGSAVNTNQPSNNNTGTILPDNLLQL